MSILRQILESSAAKQHEEDTTGTDIAFENAFMRALADWCDVPFDEVEGAFFTLLTEDMDLAHCPHGWAVLSTLMLAPGAAPLRATIH